MGIGTHTPVDRVTEGFHYALPSEPFPGAIVETKYLIAQHRDADMAFLVYSGVIDLGGECDLGAG